MGISNRITLAREWAKLSKSELARRCGVKPQAVTQWEKGDTKAPTSSNLLKIARITSHRYEWLIEGKGPPQDTNEVALQKAGLMADWEGVQEVIAKYGSESPRQIAELAEGPEIRGKRVPLISEVQAGNWTDVIDNFAPGDAEDWIPTTASIGPHAFALRVQGDSMTAPSGKSIPEGAIVIVDPDVAPENGSIVVAKLVDSDRATLKKLVIDGPNRYLRALNPDYAVIPINGNCQIVGVAKKVEFDI